jgi:ClpP class serine protease
LLQIQLENTEKVREETQKTIKTLREEFVALVQEMQMQQVYRNDNNSIPREHRSEQTFTR